MKKTFFKFLPPAVWFVLIFILTSVPHPAMPDALQVKHIDKLVHFAMYLPFGFLLLRAMGARGLRSFLIAGAVCLAAASCDELHQTFIPGRGAELLDFSADLAGGLLGMCLFLLTRMKENRT